MNMILLKKADQYYYSRKYAQAIKLYVRILSQISDRESREKIYNNLGWCYDQCALVKKNKKRREELQKNALKYFRKLIKPNPFKAYNGIGAVYHHQYKLKKALEYYQKMRKINAKDFSVYNNLGNVYRRLGEVEKNNKKGKDYFEKAEENYKIALKFSPKMTKESSIMNLAFFYFSNKNNQKAIFYAQKAVEFMKKRNNPTDKLWIDKMKEIIDKSKF